MNTYIRKLKDGFYYLIKGLPENHKSNLNYISRFHTRYMAMKYAKENGYKVIIKNHRT